MRGLLRLIFMFAPLIMRQVSRYQAKKQRERYTRDQGRNQGRGRERQRDYNRQEERDQMRNERMRQRDHAARNQRQAPRAKRPTPPPPVLSEDEKNYKLTEEEIMIDPKIMEQYQGSSPKVDDLLSAPSNPSGDSTNKEEVFKNESDSEEETLDLKDLPEPMQAKKEDDIDLKGIFFED